MAWRCGQCGHIEDDFDLFSLASGSTEPLREQSGSLSRKCPRCRGLMMPIQLCSPGSFTLTRVKKSPQPSHLLVKQSPVSSGFALSLLKREKTSREDRLAGRLQELAGQVLDGKLDESASRAFHSIWKEMALLMEEYRRAKESLLADMGAPPKIQRTEAPEERLIRKLQMRTKGSAERHKERYFGLKQVPDLSVMKKENLTERSRRRLALERGFMLSLEIQPASSRSWIEALARLTIYRKRMQDGRDDKGTYRMSTFMHCTDAKGMNHSFTHLDYGDMPTGVYLWNSKDTEGQGATRVISFVDDSGEIINPDFETVSLDSLRTVDISYFDLYMALKEIQETYMGGSGARLATFLLGLMGIGDCPDYRLIFHKTLKTKPKIKPLLRREPVPMESVHLPVGTVCVTLLSILFLTEPKHAMPMWVSNRDALMCIAEGSLTFEELLNRQLVFAVARDSGAVRYQLVPASEDNEGSIGYLLASGNVAATTLEPALRHTRKLKEMLMPVCEDFFTKSQISIPRLFKAMQDIFGPAIYEGFKIDPWFVPELDWEDKQPKIKIEMQNKKRRRLVKAIKEMSAEHVSSLVQIRQQTFVAPIIKVLLLRELAPSSKL